MDYEDSLTVKTAWYYYIGSMIQQRTSEKLGISRMKATKLLEKAEQTGVIRFKTSPKRGRQLMIEQKLTARQNLKDIFMVPTPPSGSNLNETIAQAAVMYMGDRLVENMLINMGYGNTPSRILSHLATIAESPISIVSLTGGVSHYLPNIRSSIFNAKLYLHPAPLLVSSREMYKAVHNEPPIEETARMARLITTTVIGIGAMNDGATIISNGILNQNNSLYLPIQGAVGDILIHFIDKDGKPIHSDVEERLFSTPLGTLESLNSIIGISNGPQKVEAIRAALKGGYLDVLVTDGETAIQLIDLS